MQFVSFYPRQSPHGYTGADSSWSTVCGCSSVGGGGLGLGCVGTGTTADTGCTGFPCDELGSEMFKEEIK